jgi:hypothetical protein
MAVCIGEEAGRQAGRQDAPRQKYGFSYVSTLCLRDLRVECLGMKAVTLNKEENN